MDVIEKTYSEYTDEKLLSMHASGLLTEEAYQVLEKELSRRGIPIPQSIEEDITPGKKNTNESSIVSAVSGILLIVDFLYLFYITEPTPEHVIINVFIAMPLLVLLALVSGFVALLQIRRSKGKERGSIFAIFGLLMGVIYITWIYWSLSNF